MIGSQPALPVDDPQRARAGTAISWGAILAGAAVAVAATVLLVALGAGLGFAAISPWSGRGTSAATFAISGAIWLIVTQWLSSAMGGYIAGRLRHRWLATHAHEVFFRDTAHGLVTWSVATLAVALVAAFAAGALGTGAARAGGSAMQGAMAMRGHAAPGPSSAAGAAAGPHDEGTYSADKLFRDPIGAGLSGGATTGPGMSGQALPMMGPAGDSSRIVVPITARIIESGAIADDDRSYLAAVVAAKTGIPAGDAQQRVDTYVAGIKDSEARAKSAADTARKAAAETAIYTALAMLIGAFVASVAAAIGGRLRDEHL